MIFVTGRWIKQHPQDFAFLCKFPKLFALENHGLQHRPCSINGASAYNIQGTRNLAELIEEVKGGGKFIKKYTREKPHYYRSGTAYYDDVAVKVVHALGYAVIGFTVLGDAGATFTQHQARDAIATASSGSIIIAHINHPEKPAGTGVVEGIKALQEANYRFVKLADYQDLLI
jgi:peptidoglycan/xylan/chitin deacetylase (PgdA/CDA1 family)